MLLCSFTKKKTGSVFPSFCHATFYHHRNVSRAGYNCSDVSRSGFILFYSRPCDQESTNGSPCLVEWKFRNITQLDVTSCVRMHTLVHVVVRCWEMLRKV